MKLLQILLCALWLGPALPVHATNWFKTPEQRAVERRAEAAEQKIDQIADSAKKDIEIAKNQVERPISVKEAAKA